MHIRILKLSDRTNKYEYFDYSGLDNSIISQGLIPHRWVNPLDLEFSPGWEHTSWVGIFNNLREFILI